MFGKFVCKKSFASCPSPPPQKSSQYLPIAHYRLLASIEPCEAVRKLAKILQIQFFWEERIKTLQKMLSLLPLRAFVRNVGVRWCVRSFSSFVCGALFACPVGTLSLIS